MRPDIYNERHVRAHIKKFKDILYTPGVLNLTNDISDSLSAAFSGANPEEAEEKPEDQKIEEAKGESVESEPKAVENNTQDEAKSEATNSTQPTTAEQELPKSETTENTKAPTEEEAKKAEEDYNKMVTNYKDSLQELRNSIPTLNFEDDKINLESIYENILEKDISDFEPVKCIESISFSTFNPPPPQHQLKGDLLYIKIKTLEGGEHVITCNSRGFYVNNSVENLSFDPSPSQKVNPCFSHSLVGLMYQLSDKFSERIEEHINKLLRADPF